MASSNNNQQNGGGGGSTNNTTGTSKTNNSIQIPTITTTNVSGLTLTSSIGSLNNLSLSSSYDSNLDETSYNSKQHQQLQQQQPSPSLSRSSSSTSTPITARNNNNNPQNTTTTNNQQQQQQQQLHHNHHNFDNTSGTDIDDIYDNSQYGEDGLVIEVDDFDLTNGGDIMADSDNLLKDLEQYSTYEQVIENALKKEIDINQYSEEVDSALKKYDQEIMSLYNDIIPDYVNERESFFIMYKTLKESNNILTSFEEMLLVFQKELTSISSEMRNLQELSITEHSKVNNRRALLERLHKVVEDLSLPDQVVQEIAEKVYSPYIKNYINFLEKLQIDPSTKNDLIGIPESKTKGFFSSKSNKVLIKASIFSVESRFQIIMDLEQPPLIPESISSGNSATTNQIKYSYEIIFRSMLYFIIDLVSYENMFIKDYFFSNIDPSTFIFGKSETYFMHNLISFCHSTYDPIALLLILSLANRYRVKSKSQECDVTERLFEQSITASTSRLKILFTENIESIRNTSIKELGPITDNRPHYVIRRYSELIGSITQVYEHLPPKILPFINDHLEMLRIEITKLLIKLSDDIKDTNSKYIFLLNNYDLILTILNDKLNEDNNDDKDYWSQLYQKESELYANEQLSSFPYFRNMIKLSKELYPLINHYTAEEINHPQLKKEIHEELLKDFSLNWRVGIEEMNVIVTLQFPNYKNGTKIFQMILEKLYNSYKQFTQIILKYFKSLKSLPYFIPDTEISYEIKKYCVSFE
eukprot:gene5060-6299_t